MTIHRTLGGAHAWFTDRHGGVSSAPYASLNLADHVGDDPAAVASNRRRVLDQLGHPGARWVQPHHVHGTTVRTILGDADTDISPPIGTATEADGTATSRRGIALVAIGADCAPVAIANDSAWAAVHAGWRGAADGVIDAGVAAVRALGSGRMHAVVGPCVCVGHYEFGPELLATLRIRLGDAVVGTTLDGTPAFDLRAAIVAACTRSGVDSIEVLDVCTVESPDHYSYRRDGVTGRHGVVVVAR